MVELIAGSVLEVYDTLYTKEKILLPPFSV